MTDKTAYDIAKELKEHEHVDGVRASERQITVAHAPDERHVETIPDSMYEHIMDVIAGTEWDGEYQQRAVERHEWSGGVHHSPVLKSSDQPAGYELQFLLASVR